MTSFWDLALREQQQLFLWDWGYISDTLCQMGGLSVLSGRFLVQFFHSPAAAMILTGLLLALLVYEAWRLGGGKPWAVPAALVPGCAALLCLQDLSLHYEFLTTLAIASGMACLHARVSGHEVLRGAAGTVAAWLLTGSGAVIYSLCAMIVDMRKRTILSFTYPVVAVACGLTYYLTGSIGEFGRTLTPAFFYDLTSEMPWVYAVLWVSMPAAALCSFAGKASHGWVCSAVIAILGGALAMSCNRSAYNKTERQYARMELLAVNEKWDELAGFSRRLMTDYIAANYYNLAMAEKGRLTEDLFKAPQRGPYSLVYITGEHNADTRLAHIMYACGNMAGAQNIAFNALQSRCGYNPSMMEIVADVDIMRGAYGAASKYTDILKKAPRYKKWAMSRERLLWNDSLVESEPATGNGRHDLPDEDGFVMDRSPMDELLKIVEANPSDTKAMQYALSYLLLAKDLQSTYAFIDRYYGSPALMSLPTPAQEALLFYGDYSSNVLGDESVSRDYCRSHGVTDSTIEKFDKFQQATLRSGGNAPAGFGDTFWNYMLYTKI